MIGSRELTFYVDRNDKPLIYVSGDQESRTSCLIDTGANLPVWLPGEEYLKYRYPKVHKHSKRTMINGLGDRPLMDVPVWVLQEFTITDTNGESITFKELPIAVLKTEKFTFDMIIPMTMLNRMDFSFSFLESALWGVFKIRTDKDVFFVRPEISKNNKDYLNKIQVFIEES